MYFPHQHTVGHVWRDKMCFQGGPQFHSQLETKQSSTRISSPLQGRWAVTLVGNQLKPALFLPPPGQPPPQLLKKLATITLRCSSPSPGSSSAQAHHRNTLRTLFLAIFLSVSVNSEADEQLSPRWPRSPGSRRTKDLTEHQV